MFFFIVSYYSEKIKSFYAAIYNIFYSLLSLFPGYHLMSRLNLLPEFVF